MTQAYKTDALAAIHETMEALHQVGAVDKQTMRDFDARCLAPLRLYSPEEIKALRSKYKVSQPVLARYLNVTKNSVSEWERGIKKPSGAVLRLLTILDKKGLDVFA
ncbi:DNA-binding transcriptional regulator [Thiomicrospira sp. R3]|uniref:helix-turn-helix domain-containing protein n=1 Tax=Thiomicrospira sp. R3 TaxID=3035472 RepID=UPI00259BC9AF|nr:DNA-binding transcriptional regulator [Thiomicrospira sp. R3]WFE69698.1 DNA-binding transcriptional regulator [Thiomicrospira sp. R3]